MTIDEVIDHVDEGRKVFVGTGNSKRIVLNAGRAWIEYELPSQPNTINCVFTKDFARWAKGVEKDE